MSKNNNQVFTPTEVATQMLDEVGYTTNLNGKKILENSCGDGQILEIIIMRYVQDCLTRSMNIHDIQKGLGEDITAYETDETLYMQCMKRITRAAETFGIHDVKWRLYLQDYLLCEHQPQYDYIVGNPPYISHGVMPESIRTSVKSKYETCQTGSFDYCFAFIEASLNDLQTGGQMAYIIPGSIFKTRAAKDLRERMLPHIKEIFDYASVRLFDDVLTSSAIIFLENDSNLPDFTYRKAGTNNSLVVRKSELASKWFFYHNEPLKQSKRFGDDYQVATVIATQANKVFVISEYHDAGECIETEGFYLEKGVLKRAFSPRLMNTGKEEYIIFPYSYGENGLQRFSEEEFCNQYPETARYLKHHHEKLTKRKADKDALWFEYGRTQALAHLNQPKLMTSTVFTKRMKAHLLGRDDIPYSGLYIVPKGSLSLEHAKAILESDMFAKHISICGLHVSGQSMRLVAEDILNYHYNPGD